MWAKIAAGTLFACVSMYAGASYFGFMPDRGSSEPSHFAVGGNSEWDTRNAGSASSQGSYNAVQRRAAQSAASRVAQQRASSGGTSEDDIAAAAAAQRQLAESQPEELRRAKAAGGNDPDAVAAALHQELYGEQEKLTAQVKSLAANMDPKEVEKVKQDIQAVREGRIPNPAAESGTQSAE